MNSIGRKRFRNTMSGIGLLPDLDAGTGTGRGYKDLATSSGPVKCPITCSTETVKETWWLSTIPDTDSIPLTIQEIETVCDETTQQGEFGLTCEQIVAALKAAGYNVEGLNGLSGCNLMNPAISGIRGLRGLRGLANGDVTGKSEQPAYSSEELRGWIAQTCPDKDFTNVSDVQLLNVAVQQTVALDIKTANYAEVLKSNIIKSACSLGKQKTLLSKIPVWGFGLLAAAGIYAMVKK